MTEPVRILRRSRRDRVLGGVCGGLAANLGVDPVLVRIVVVALVLSAGVGVLVYLVGWIVIPDVDGDDEPPPVRAGGHTVVVVAGLTLVALGALLLVRAAVPGFDAVVFCSLIVIAAGTFVVVSNRG